MRELVYLDLSHNSVKNIKAVSALVNLTELSLRGNPIEDFSPLLGLSALKTLNLAATGLNDESLARLRSLSKLTSLNIEDNEDLTGVAVEEFKIQMSRCSVTHSELIFTVALGGKEFRTDSEAILASELGISDISPLIQFEKLKILNISSNNIHDLGPLARVETLEVLDVSSNLVSSLAPLGGHKKLNCLLIRDNKLKTLAGLSNIPRSPNFMPVTTASLMT